MRAATCKLRARDGYHPAQYVAQGLPETFPAKRFAERLRQDGGISMVGDSIMLHLHNEFKCQMEYQGLPTDRVEAYGIDYVQQFYTFLPDDVYDRFELRHPGIRLHHELAKAMSLDWVDKVIEKKKKYVLWTTAAWWNPTYFYHRGPWSEYKNWTDVSIEELLGIYRTTLEQTILPVMKSLVDDHGIIPIFMDMPPAGRINLSDGTHGSTNWKGYYYIYAKYNEVGRDVMARAGGLVLPLWDATMPRWQDHRFTDSTTGYDDQLHWCEGASPNNSLPTVWLKMLLKILYGDSFMNDDNVTVNSQSNFITDRVPQWAIAAQSKTSQFIFSSGHVLDDMTISLLSKSHLKSPNCSEADNEVQCSSNILCMRDESNLCIERFE
jgi:hypothetical protein